jgi:hypothetical protein
MVFALYGFVAKEEKKKIIFLSQMLICEQERT